MDCLEIVNNYIIDIKKSLDSYVCACHRYGQEVSDYYKSDMLKCIKQFEIIKQELEEKQKLETKLDGCIQLIKNLFNEIEIDCHPEYYTNNYGEEDCADVYSIKHDSRWFHITEELYDILYDLKKGYIKEGDSNEKE